MEIGQKIQKLRAEHNLSQEELAVKIYVSRQTISNWENDKSYPDIKSLLLVSSLFSISLDALVKGDIEEMKKEINAAEVTAFKKEANIFAGLLVATIIVPIPLFHSLKIVGLGIWGIIAILCFYHGFKLEKAKKNFEVQTYREILAFFSRKSLSTDEKNQEKGKKMYQTVFILLGCALFTVTISIIMILIFK